MTPPTWLPSGPDVVFRTQSVCQDQVIYTSEESCTAACVPGACSPVTTRDTNTATRGAVRDRSNTDGLNTETLRECICDEETPIEPAPEEPTTIFDCPEL